MAATLESLSRTTSGESVRSNSSHYLSNASSSSTRKGQYADMEPANIDAERADISMPPPASKPTLRYQNMAPPMVRPGDAPSASSGSADNSIGPKLDGSKRASEELNRKPLLGGDLLDSSQSRRSDPEIETKRSSFYGLYNPYRSAPSSVAGGSDQDAHPDGKDRGTTATQSLNVMTLSQNGALSPPPITDSLKEPPFASVAAPSPIAASSVTSPSSPPPYNVTKEGRTVQARGRTPVNSRRVSSSNPGSASASSDRGANNTSEKPSVPKIGTIGICALDSKARSKPSRNILNRLVGKENDFDVIIFGDKVILDESVENWPVCDFLISFFSEGFPLDKAIAYAKMRRPFCVNDIPMQTILWDRRICLDILDKLGVPTPGRLEVNRDGGPVIETSDIAQRMKQLTGVKLDGPDGRGGDEKAPFDIHLEDDEDTLVVNGRRLSKPFVEKPVSGEDHNINIYYPKSQGGGGRRLFRKINNKSSEKDEKLTVPMCITDTTNSYIYEKFLKTENAEDVKAYTVGPDYCHAETRKSPVVDGVVKRNPNGKEIRYVTSLSKEEQIMAAKIATGFGQRVCGFDLLRVGDGDERSSYVIDVNGWSFVKDNNEYYDKCASIMRSMFIREKVRWEGKMTPSDTEENKQFQFSETDKAATAGFQRKPTFEKERERGSHRSALKSVLRSRSISQLRDHVSNAAHKVGHPHAAKTSSGRASPISNSPTIERTPDKQKVPSLPARDDLVLPPAIAAHGSQLRASVDGIAGRTEEVRAGEESPELPKAVPAPASKSQWKLKGMVAVIRHADRTPKQKFKFTFHTKPFVDLLKGHQEEVLLVGDAALHSVQAAVRQALMEGVEDMSKLRTLENALAKKGGWPGTKVQIKPMFKKPKGEEGGGGEKKVKKKKSKESKELSNSHEQQDASASIPLAGPVEGEEVAQWVTKVSSEPNSMTEDRSQVGPAEVMAQSRSDSVSEVTMSRHAAADNNLVVDKLQLVMKWGGEPTHSARYQASELGDNMRNDLMLMNRAVLEDVSIFTSSERRVTTSAQIFAGTFLDQKDIEDNQIRVRKDLLDDSNAAKDEMDRVKKKLKGLLREGNPPPKEFAWPKDMEEPYLVVRKVVELMKFHRRVMRHNFSKLQTSDAVSALERIKSPMQNGLDADPSAVVNGSQQQPQNQASNVQARWCTGEDAELFKERWEKLFNEFIDAEKVDPSKISELYDTMKFDALHNRQFLEWVFTPSQSLLLEEDGDGDTRLRRTESVVAREEFAQTHDGMKPNTDAKGDHEVPDPMSQGVPRTSTASTTASGIIGPADKERHQLAHKVGLRRRSADLMSAARNALANSNEEESYFNLYKGNSAAVESKVRSDLRLEKLNELYSLSKILFDFIGPQEYGITNSEKLEIGLLTSLPLLREIVKDIEEVQASDDAKSFIYFTKESHIYTLLNCILEGGVQTKIARNAIPELDYLSQICFELYESENAEADIDPANPDTNFNYSIRISISPGCHTFDPLDVQLDSKHCIGNAPRRSLVAHRNWKEVLETLRARFHTVKLPKSFTAVNLSEKVPQEFATDERTEEPEELKIEAGTVAQPAE